MFASENERAYDFKQLEGEKPLTCEVKLGRNQGQRLNRNKNGLTSGAVDHKARK